MGEQLVVRVLGPVEVRAGERLVRIPGRQPLRVLAVLAADVGRPVTAERLIDALWGDRPPASVGATLQMHVGGLRRALDPAWRRGSDSAIVTTRDGYQLDVPPGAVDEVELTQLTASARAAAPARAAELLASARALWRGRPYAELAGEPWIADRVRHLEEQRRSVDEDWADAQLALGRELDIVDELSRAARAEPLRERRWAQLMVALYRADRQGDALRAFHEARSHLRREMGIEPSDDLRRLEHAILNHDVELRRSRALAPPHRLPPKVARLVGRDRELAAVERLARTTRLVTIVGPPGIGKTRLAVEAAWELDAAFRDGVVFAPLGGVASGDLVPYALATALGVVEQGEHGQTDALRAVTAALRDKQLLLVADGCDPETPEVGRLVLALLARCPGVAMLATSRAPLGAPGEALARLGRLDVPAEDAADDEVRSSASIELLLDRVGGDAAPVTSERLDELARLARIVDGVPHSLELAAAAMRSWPVASIIDRWETSVAREDGALDEVIRWSTSMLLPAERTVLRRLAAFPDGFSLSGAEAVAGDESMEGNAVAALVARLVHASLLSFDVLAQHPRYRFLEPVRRIARKELADVGEAAMVERRIVDHLLACARAVAPSGFGPPSLEALAALDAEQGNVRAVLRSLLDARDILPGVELACAQADHWFETGRWGEGRRWLEEVRARRDELPGIVRARTTHSLARVVSTFAGIATLEEELLEARETVETSQEATLRDRFSCAGYLAIASGWNGNGARAAAALQDMRAMADEAESEWGRAVVDSMTGLGAMLRGDLGTARHVQHRCAERFVELGDEGYAGRVLMYAASFARLQGDDDGAREDLDRCVAHCRRSANRGTLAHALLIRAQLDLEHRAGDAAVGLREAREALAAVGDERCLAIAHRDLAAAALMDGDPVDALTVGRHALHPLAELDELALSLALAEFARALVEIGSTARIADIADAADALGGGAGLPLTGAEARRRTAALMTVRQLAAVEAGSRPRSWTPAAAVALALAAADDVARSV